MEVIIDIIINAATDTVIDIIIFSTQTLVFFINSNILLKIDLCLLTGKAKVKE